MADDVKQAVDGLMTAFNEFKAANDQNLKQRDALLEDKLNKINASLDQYEALNQKLTLSDQQQKAMQEQMDRVETVLNRGGLGGDGSKKDAEEYRAAFDRVMRKPAEARDRADMDLIHKRQAALVKSDDTGAGYLLAPPDLQAEIIKDVIEMTPMRALATVRTIGTGSLKQPKRTGTGSATRVGETQPRTNTGDPSYGMIEILAPEMFARIEVSQQMLEDSAYDLLAELREDAAEQFAVKEGAEFISGTGANNQAEGILTNADVAFTVSGSASSIADSEGQANGLITLYHDLKTVYARRGVWGLNRKTLGAIRRLKDADKNYIWQPGIANGVPNTILGASYAEMPDMPDIGAGAYPVVFGDFGRAYVIVDRIAISFQVDYTTGADNGLVVFRARKRVGGGVRQAEAIRKLKIAA